MLPKQVMKIADSKFGYETLTVHHDDTLMCVCVKHVTHGVVDWL